MGLRSDVDTLNSLHKSTVPSQYRNLSTVDDLMHTIRHNDKYNLTEQKYNMFLDGVLVNISLQYQ